MKYTIEVTQEDIDNGRMACADLCPVAIAMTRVLNKKILVAPRFWVEKNTTTENKLPGEVTNFVWDFDDSKPVSPFTFTIEL